MQSGIRRLILLGAGHAHLHVLARLAEYHPADLQVTLISPHDAQTYSGMVPGLVAGRYGPADVQIPLAPLVQSGRLRWLVGRCTGIDAANARVHWAPTAGGEIKTLEHDLLSIDTGAVLRPERLEADMPGARTHGLPLRPMENFTTLWPEVVALARERPISLAVIGAGAGGIETVFAAAERLRREGVPGATFTLVTGGAPVGANYRTGVRQRVLRRLKRAGIHVLREACVGIDAQGVHLANGAVLRCDVPLLAIGTHAPAWLQGSGLALCSEGHVLVNRYQQSTSHANVFAAGDVATRDDWAHPRSGVYAVRAGPALAHNLFAALSGQPLKPHHPPRNTLNLLSCGTGHAIASWGPLHTEGAWVWRWKDRIDQRFVRQYRREAGTPAAGATPHPVDQRAPRGREPGAGAVD
jgi:pyridine nucleotide-disulfide oxidoreductase family protein